MPTNNELKYGFHESKLVNNQAAGILYFIESKIRDRRKHSTSLLGFNRYTLEHIMPKKWENNWEILSSEQETLFRNKKLLTLGNLTIITASLNSSIRDSKWATKKNGTTNNYGLMQYASGLDTFSQYLSLPVWNEDKITERAEFLCTQAMYIWPES